MMRIEMAPEPKNFNTSVRQKGLAFLQGKKHPVDFTGQHYWRNAKKDLYGRYKRICAYNCCYIYNPEKVSVDHFIPKGSEQGWQLAYEWSNFRLSSVEMNQRKGNQIVPDPFLIPVEAFHMDFPTLLIQPNPGLDEDWRMALEGGISQLGLNDDTLALATRLRHYNNYLEQKIFADLKKYSPFLAYELQRQGLVEKVLTWKRQPTR